MGRLTLTSKGLSWFAKGHPWIFRDDLQKIHDAEPGSLVTLENRTGAFLAQGFYSDCSKIAFRLVSRSKDPVDRVLWKDRLVRAARYREIVVRDTDACRMVYGESDGIPSLILDRYENHLVMQALSQGADRLVPVFADILSEIIRPSSILLRNDAAVRSLENLPLEKKVLAGAPPGRIEVHEGKIRYRVDPWTGQKTGAYLDQRENRAAAGSFLRGDILDCFAYQGLFALHAAGNASHVVAVDASQEALHHAAENASLNALGNVEFRKENVFDFLKEEMDRGNRYDGIILDPPAFAKSRKDIDSAARGYKELNLRAVRLLKPGGILVTCSCSYNLSESRFLEILKGCERDTGAFLRIIQRRSQSADHPVLLAFPESFYLKCVILEKAG